MSPAVANAKNLFYELSHDHPRNDIVETVDQEHRDTKLQHKDDLEQNSRELYSFSSLCSSDFVTGTGEKHMVTPVDSCVSGAVSIVTPTNQNPYRPGASQPWKGAPSLASHTHT